MTYGERVLQRYFRRFHSGVVSYGYEGGHVFARCQSCQQTMCGGRSYASYHLEAEGHKATIANH